MLNISNFFHHRWNTEQSRKRRISLQRLGQLVIKWEINHTCQSGCGFPTQNAELRATFNWWIWQLILLCDTMLKKKKNNNNNSTLAGCTFVSLFLIHSFKLKVGEVISRELHTKNKTENSAQCCKTSTTTGVVRQEGSQLHPCSVFYTSSVHRHLSAAFKPFIHTHRGHTGLGDRSYGFCPYLDMSGL